MAQYMSNVVVDELHDKVAMASPTDCIILRICQTPQQFHKIVLSPEIDPGLGLLWSEHHHLRQQFARTWATSFFQQGSSTEDSWLLITNINHAFSQRGGSRWAWNTSIRHRHAPRSCLYRDLVCVFRVPRSLGNPMFEQRLMVHGSSLGIMVRETRAENSGEWVSVLATRNSFVTFCVRATNVARCVTSRRMRWVTVECGRLQWFLPTMTHSCAVIYCNQYFFDTFVVATLKYYDKYQSFFSAKLFCLLNLEIGPLYQIIFKEPILSRDYPVAADCSMCNSS
jgi:hypothetical protein